ncbi:hypothetical protein BBP40_004125 [Aspergillus hancockii]|nr:hypothetical protein BBP40_004125 [Aspergillus hancockii]
MASAHYLGSSETSFDAMEIQVRQRVLKGLRQALSKQALDWDDVLVPTIFLCSSAISNGCHASWVKHLTCFQLVVKQIIHGHRDAPPVPPFFISYFSAHLVLAKSLFPIDDMLPAVNVSSNIVQRHNPSPSIPPTEGTWTSTSSLAKIMQTNTLDEIDVWNGFSNQMLLLINEILSLKDNAQTLHYRCLIATTPRTVIEQRQVAINTKISMLEMKLATIRQRLPASLLQPHEPTEHPHRCHLLDATAEAYHLAACLLLSEATNPTFLGYTLASRGHVMRSQDYVDRIFSLVDEVVTPLDYLPTSWPLWPLFIASCCCSPSLEIQARSLALFHVARGKAPYENIPRAQTVVELLWQRRKVHTEEDKSARVGRFEWELVMESLGWRTSFA